jgi:cytosine/adenosine deaminase-related metal-dependent hydrolase
MPCDILVRNGYVLTLDAQRTVYPSGAVAIQGNRIVAVGPDRELAALFRPRRVFDAAGAPVHPGMIDGHLHSTVHLTRTVFDDDPAATGGVGFTEWFNVLTDEDEYASALVAFVEMVRNGFTACMEPGTAFEPDLVAAAAEAVGVRVTLADPFLWDTVDGGNAMASRIPRVPATRRRAERLLGGQLWRNKDAESRVRAHVSLYGSGSASRELELAAKKCADEHGIVLNQHQNFTLEQVTIDDARFGGGHNLVRFAEWGLLDRNSTFVHMNVVRDDEVPLVVRSGMSLVWQPGNYQYYGMAHRFRSRMPELHKLGVNLALGVDVAKIWTFGELARIAYLVARQGGDYLSAETLLAMQTIGGAQALGLADMVGSLEAGKRADLVIRTDELAEAVPSLNAVIQIITLSQSRSIDTVICDGEVLLRHGSLTRLDERAVYEMGRASARRLAARLDRAPWTRWPIVSAGTGPKTPARRSKARTTR